MDYNELLKEQSENILFQYFNEFKDFAIAGQIDFDKYLQNIAIEDEIQDILAYNELIILKSLNIDYCDIDKDEKAITQLNKDIIPILKTLYKEELIGYRSKELVKLKNETELMNYYENKKDEIEFPKMGMNPVTNIERKERIENCNKVIAFIQKRINRLDKTINSIDS